MSLTRALRYLNTFNIYLIHLGKITTEKCHPDIGFMNLEYVVSSNYLPIYQVFVASHCCSALEDSFSAHTKRFH